MINPDFLIMSTQHVDIEKILRVATMVASGMGLDSTHFEENLRKELKTSLHIDSDGILAATAKPRHMYTLEFLRALTETPIEGAVNVNIPKVGSENPRNNPNTPSHTHPKGKYKPRGIEESYSAHSSHSMPSAHSSHQIPPSTSRDIVRSAPLPIVQRGENAWLPTKGKKDEKDPLKMKLTKIRSDLNKISTDNEETISNRIREEFTEECITELTPTFFDKGVWEQKYREIYARLCVKLSLKFPNVFMSALLSSCQREFETKVSIDEEDDVIMLLMKRRLGAIHFIVEMLKVKLLKPTIILLCANKILTSSDGEKSDHDICHIAELVIISSPIIKEKDTVAKMRGLVDTLKVLHNHQYVSQRSKFKIEDAIKVLATRK